MGTGYADDRWMIRPSTGDKSGGAGASDPRRRRVDVVLRVPQLHVGPEQCPERAPATFVRDADASGIDGPVATDRRRSMDGARSRTASPSSVRTRTTRPVLPGVTAVRWLSREAVNVASPHCVGGYVLRKP